MRTPRVSVVGIGKLGLCLSAVLASKGFVVTGVDVDRTKIEQVNDGKSPIHEPGLQELITANGERLFATSDLAESVEETDATFVVVPTPSGQTGEFSLKYVSAAMRQIGDALATKNAYHLVALTSTVMPRSMDQSIRPLLETRSGKVAGEHFGLCYSPEFIALGDVIRGLLEPDLTIIGESDPRAGETLAKIKISMSDNSHSILRMNFVNAEIAKVALNSFVTMKMSFANTLAELCEKVPGADVDAVTGAIGIDKRIGRRNLTGALGYGGPCFPRDNIAFSKFAKRMGLQADLALATDAVNIRQVARVVKMIESEVGEGARIAVLGYAYKQNTNVLEASQSLMLIDYLCKRGYEVHCYDPGAEKDELQRLVPNALPEKSAGECITKADVCVMAVPWDEFKRIDMGLFKDKSVIDCWRLYGQGVEGSSSYIALGRHRTPDSSSRRKQVVPTRVWQSFRTQ